MGTNKCLDKQLLCLYPFPHFSHLRSLAFLPSFVRCWPSLARRIRASFESFSSSSSISASWSELPNRPHRLFFALKARAEAQDEAGDATRRRAARCALLALVAVDEVVILRGAELALGAFEVRSAILRARLRHPAAARGA